MKFIRILSLGGILQKFKKRKTSFATGLLVPARPGCPNGNRSFSVLRENNQYFLQVRVCCGVAGQVKAKNRNVISCRGEVAESFTGLEAFTQTICSCPY